MHENMLKAEPRTEFGSRASRRLRAEGKLPANIYGLDGVNVQVTLDAKSFQKFLGEGHRIASIQIGEATEHGLVREVQYDALGSHMLHIDFARIRQDQEVEIEVPIETVGIPKGVSAGGVLSFPVQELLIAGLPRDVPESYSIEIESLEVGNHIRLKDLVPPPKCTFPGDPEMVIIAVEAKRGAEEIPTAPAEGESTQPEVIGRKKEAEEEGEAK